MGKSHCEQLGISIPFAPGITPPQNSSPTILYCLQDKKNPESQPQQFLLTPFTSSNARRRWKAELCVKQELCGTLQRKICLPAARPGVPVLACAAFPREAGLQGAVWEAGCSVLSLIKQWLSPPRRALLLWSLFWQGSSEKVN